MNKLTIILTILVLVLSTGIVFLIKENNENLESISRLNDNISILNTSNEYLKFKESELRNYLEDLNTTHKKEIDSVLQLLKVKPKQIISYQQVAITNTIKDTSTVAFKDTIPIVDSLYVLPFKRATECLSVSGRVISTDLNTKLYFDSIKSNNTVYIVKSYKKTFWDYVLFRKGKEVIQIEEKCGESTIKSIEVIK